MEYYHGTANINAQKIIKTQHFNSTLFIINSILWEGRRQKVKVPGSLGYGVYTFIDDPKQALMFAKKENKEPVVLQVFLKTVDEKNILDLTEKNTIKKFQKFASYAKRVEDAKKIFKAFKANKKIIGSSQDVYAGIMTELFIAFLKRNDCYIKYVKKRTETLLPPNGSGYQRLGLFNGTEFTIRYPNTDIKNIIMYHFKENV